MVSSYKNYLAPLDLAGAPSGSIQPRSYLKNRGSYFNCTWIFDGFGVIERSCVPPRALSNGPLFNLWG